MSDTFWPPRLLLRARGGRVLPFSLLDTICDQVRELQQRDPEAVRGDQPKLAGRMLASGMLHDQQGTIYSMAPNNQVPHCSVPVLERQGLDTATYQPTTAGGRWRGDPTNRASLYRGGAHRDSVVSPGEADQNGATGVSDMDVSYPTASNGAYVSDLRQCSVCIRRVQRCVHFRHAEAGQQWTVPGRHPDGREVHIARRGPICDYRRLGVPLRSAKAERLGICLCYHSSITLTRCHYVRHVARSRGENAVPKDCRSLYPSLAYPRDRRSANGDDPGAACPGHWARALP